MKRVLVAAVRVNGVWRGRIDHHALADAVAVQRAIAERQRLSESDVERLAAMESNHVER